MTSSSQQAYFQGTLSAEHIHRKPESHIIYQLIQINLNSVNYEQTKFLTIQKMRDNNLGQYPSNKPINITPMIWYDECMLFTCEIIQINL